MIDEIYNYRLSNMPTVEVSTEWSKLCIPFEESLTEEQLITFHKLLDIQRETSAAEIENSIQGRLQGRSCRYDRDYITTELNKF